MIPRLWKQAIALILFCAVLLIFVPMLVLRGFWIDGFSSLWPGRDKPLPSGNITVTLYLSKENKTLQLPLEEYLVGVLAKEMSPLFPLEALKAQAVAARTYAVQKISRGETLTDDVSTQVWMSPQERRSRWGLIKSYQYESILQQAVKETEGQVLTYNGELIIAAFHSSCGGKTESSKNLWRMDLPYLQSVPCVESQAALPTLASSATFTAKELDERLGAKISALSNKAKAGSLEVKAITDTGRVASIRVENNVLSGAQVRMALGLRSTNFNFKWHGDKVTFTTQGYGHGIGLCQSGAKEMAENGENYKTILEHYYTGVKLWTIQKQP